MKMQERYKCTSVPTYQSPSDLKKFPLLRLEVCDNNI